MYQPHRAKIILPADLTPWPHELRVAKILALAGHTVEFLPVSNIKTADILLDGVEFEIKSPERFNPNTLEHTLRNAIKQSSNLIIDTSRMKKVNNQQVQRFLKHQIYKNSQIKRLLMVTKQEKIIDIMKLTC